VSKFWRRTAVFAAAGSLLTLGALPALAATTASPAITSPAITITAASALRPVTGDVYVLYESGKYSTAKIRGDVSGAAKGDVVKLYAQPFHRKAAEVGSVKLTKIEAETPYSFLVQPSIATRYHVKLFTSGNAPPPSSVVTVYVSSGGKIVQKRGCGSGAVCSPQYRFYVYLPAAVIKGDVSRHWYVYVGVKLSATGIPGYPTWLNLDSHASISRLRRITARQYERTIGFSFRVGNDGARWLVTACVKDVEAKDGIGLPGSHGCGALHVRRTVAYLG
jgi:hypothetical protein